ncbi:MAG TPA: DUF2721 domain-containing protein [Phycisphaerales bacterium]|nr:DUF2721 domain-containing protein [Phycisphaerales bacterium]
MDAPIDTHIADNPFAVLTFLAAPAILTNASTLLILSTSNRLARASDRARLASTAILNAKSPGIDTAANHREFQHAHRRAEMLVSGLRSFYFAAGCFAAGTCMALLGAFAGYFSIPGVPLFTQVMTSLLAVLGVAGLVAGSLKLLRETRIALASLADLHVSITQWRATHAGDPPPGNA